MNELIAVKHSNLINQQGVSAKALYIGLGLEKSQWSRWSPLNIENNEFFKQAKDWQGFDTMANGNTSVDYVVMFRIKYTG